jgi:hypothetical protein
MRMTKRLRYGAVALLLAATAACSDPIADHVLGIDAVGDVFIFLYLDNDLSTSYVAARDTRLTNISVDLVMRGSATRVHGGVTDSLGIRAFKVPVGRYTVHVDSTVTGDTLELESNPEFTVVENDTRSYVVGLKYLTYSVDEARSLPTTRRAWMRGVVVNSPNTFGDSTVHVLSDTGSVAIRVVGVRPVFPVIAGDTALFLGQRSERDGQIIWLSQLPGPDPVIFSAGPPPVPDTLTSAVAATADGGTRDARFAIVPGATVADTVTISGAKVLHVDDGSGPLAVVLSPNINFGTFSQYVPGAVLDVTGVLIADPAVPGTWVLKPRARVDIVIQP